MSNSFGKVDKYFKKEFIDEERSILMKNNDELSQEIDHLIEENRSLREQSIGEELIYDALDWSLTKRPSGRSVYYIINDKVSGTSVRVTYDEDARDLRGMLKAMRLDNIQCDKERRLLDSKNTF